LAIAGVSFSLVVLLCVLTGFEDRGAHFLRDKYASNTNPTLTTPYDLKRLRILTRCMGYVRTNYVEPQRIDEREMAIAALERIESEIPEILSDSVRDKDENVLSAVIRVGSKEREFSLKSVETIHQLNWKFLDIFQFIDSNLSPQTSRREVEFAAIKGALSTLDPHSSFLDPAVYGEMKVGTTGGFGGLGIVIGSKEGKLVIQSVLEGTPAHNAKLRSNDTIVQIESESTVNMPLSEAVKRLRGPPGAPVNIWILRKGLSEPRRYQIVRDYIRIQSVTSRLTDNGIAVVALKNFQQSTGKELVEALSTLEGQWHQKTRESLRGLVLDLRNNPGGLLDQAVAVSDVFINDGVLVTTVGGGSRVREEKVATNRGTWREIPMVVLVNPGSASASEIVAGALRNTNRAVIVGEQTFGKGSVQVLYEIEDAALKLTVAQYLTPGGESIQGIGITPHVSLVPMIVTKERMDIGVERADGEGALENHLESDALATNRTPAVRIPYVYRVDEPDGENEESANDDGEAPTDFAESLALRILLDAGRKSASEFLKRAMPVFSLAEREQQSRFVESMGKLDVDWNEGNNPRRAKIKLEMTTDLEGKRAEAGSTIQLTSRVTNLGKHALHRLRITTESDLHAVDKLDFIIGKVPANESRQWAIPVKLSKALTSQTVRLTARAYNDRSQKVLAGTKESHMFLPIQGRARPRFGYSSQVIDVVGNGNGLLGSGEKIKLRVRVHNLGDGPVKKAVATLSNRGGGEIFITEGRAQFSNLKADQNTVLEFDLEARDGVISKGTQLELRIRERTLGQTFVHQLKVPIEAKDSPSLRDRLIRWGTQEQPLNVYSGASKETGLLGIIGSEKSFFSDAVAGSWVRIPLEPDGYGWVNGTAMTKAKTTERISQRLQLDYMPQVLEPVISLDLESPELVETETILFKGLVDFPTLDHSMRPDMYIFLDRDKVFYRQAEQTDAKKIHFEAKLSLKKGMNYITVHARAGGKLQSKKRVRIYRQERK